MAFKVISLNPKEPMEAFNMIFFQKLSKSDRERNREGGPYIWKSGMDYGDFYKNLKLCTVNIDIKNDLDLDLITNVKLEKLLGKRG